MRDYDKLSTKDIEADFFYYINTDRHNTYEACVTDDKRDEMLKWNKEMVAYLRRLLLERGSTYGEEYIRKTYTL